MWKFYNIFCLILMVFAPLNVQAHRLNSALSIIEISNSNDFAEITHRIYVHDLEQAMGLNKAPIDFFRSQIGQKTANDYARKHFHIKDMNGAELPTNFVGAEIEGDVLYIYFTIEFKKLSEIYINSKILQDFSQNQINYVNIHKNGETISLVFNKNQQAQKLRLAN
jgi:hypothetical protein